MKIIIKNLQRRIIINPAKIRRLASKIKLPSRLNNLKINLYFVKNSVIKKLNLKFFGKNYATDVISFDLGKDYAEIFIAPSVVKENAFIFKTEFKEELYRCVIHGVLHIFGFNDKIKKEKNIMWKAQEAILKKISSIKEDDLSR